MIKNQDRETLNKRIKHFIEECGIFLICPILTIALIIFAFADSSIISSKWNDGVCDKCGCEWYYNSEESTFWKSSFECRNGHKIKLNARSFDEIDSRTIEDLHNWNEGKCKTCNSQWRYKDSNKHGYIFECNNSHFIILKDLPEENKIKE